MSNPIAQQAVSLLSWLAHHPTCCVALIVCVQISFVAVLAMMMARVVSHHDTSLTYGVWLSAVVMALAVVPIHVATNGWSIRIAEVDQWAAPHSVGRGIATDENHHRVSGVTLSDETIRQVGPTNDVASKLTPGPSDAQRSSSKSVFVGQSSGATSDNRLSARNVRGIVFGIYLCGCLAVVSRFVLGVIRLNRWNARGSELDERIQKVARQTASIAGLKSTPSVRASAEAAMPMTFGLFRPAILVPVDFADWSSEEQYVSLLHESVHMRRRDVLGQWLAKLMNVVYWFHPAGWYLDRRLTEAREWATDRQVVMSGSSIAEAQNYAKCLVNIVARMSQTNTPRRVIDGSAISMSTTSDIENRLSHILRTSTKRSPGWVIATRVMIGCLVLATAMMTVRFESAAAQETAQSVAETATSASMEIARIGENDNDLIATIRDCNIHTAGGDGYQRLTVSGKVLSTKGEPIQDAIVLLRESGGHRIYVEPSPYLTRDDFYMLRTHDVFARTSSGEDGKFEFHGVKSPGFKKRPNHWVGSIVASHPEFGVGQADLSEKNEIVRFDTGINLILHPTSSISGRFLSPEGEPIAGAVVNLDRLTRLTIDHLYRAHPVQEFHLTASQLAPRSETDAEGRFEMSGIPRGFIALVYVHHSDGTIGRAAIATSKDVPVGKGLVRSHWLSDIEAVHSPAGITAEPPVYLAGKVVDSFGDPVPDVELKFTNHIRSTRTAQDGTFRLRRWGRPINRDDSSKIHLRPDASTGMIRTVREISNEVLLSGTTTNIQLRRGVSVRGKVQTADGSPVPGASVRLASASNRSATESNENGEFELLLTPGSHVIIAGTDHPDFDAPNLTELSQITAPEQAINLPHAHIDVSDGADNPTLLISVATLKPIEAHVLMPDGSDAHQASVMVKDESGPFRLAHKQQIRPYTRFVNKSEISMTDRSGRAKLLTSGRVTAKAIVEAKLATEENVYYAKALLSDAVDGILRVQLAKSIIVEGRVMIEETPVVGAKVSVGIANRLDETTGATKRAMTIVSDFSFATTGQGGWYRVTMARAKQYAASVKGISGQLDGSRSFQSDTPVVGNKVRMEDIVLTRKR